MPPVRGPAIKAAYKAKRMKRADFAAATGIKPRTLTNALGPNRAPLDDSKIEAIAEVLGWAREDVVEVKTAALKSPPARKGTAKGSKRATGRGAAA
jgi:transcriptional regulator with XRE-family HTH domain